MKIFVCKHPRCPKTYATHFGLQRHLASHQPKSYRCKECPKSFSLAQYLKEHSYIHTGELPFVCDHPSCDAKFKQAGRLSFHRKLHQNLIFHIKKVNRSKKPRNVTSVSRKGTLQNQMRAPVGDDSSN